MVEQSTPSQPEDVAAAAATTTKTTIQKNEQGQDIIYITKPGQPTKAYVKKREVPGLSYLLAHGDPDAPPKPQTWWQAVKFPLAVLILFYITLELFLRYIPKSNRVPYHIPKGPRTMGPPPVVSKSRGSDL
jgi:hypothetical protein